MPRPLLYTALVGVIVLIVLLIDGRDSGPTGPVTPGTPSGPPPDPVQKEPMSEEAAAEAPDAGDTRIAGEVRDADGAPVAGAVVQAVPLGEHAEVKAAAAAITTGGDGRFLFADVEPGKYALLASGDDRGFGSHPLVEVRAGREALVSIRLVTGTTIEGRVVDADGAPIPGARVSTDAARRVRELYRSLNLPGKHLPRATAEHEAPAGPDGAFRLVFLSPGKHDLRVVADGFLDHRVRAVQAPSRNVEVVLERSGALEIMVEILGDPLPELLLVVVDDELIAEEILGGRRHRFNFPGVRPGEREIVASAAGFTRARRTVHVEPGVGTGPVRLSIRLGTLVRGTVRDHETGKPVAGAIVELSSVERQGGGIGSQVETTVIADQAGRWEARLRPGEWIAEATAEGYTSAPEPEDAEWDWEVFRVGDEPRERDLLLAADRDTHAFAITGSVVYGDGVPAAGAHVGVVGGGLNPEVAKEGGVLLSSEMDVVTAPDGSFRIDRKLVPWGRYDLEAWGPRYGVGRAENVRFRPGEMEARAEIVLDRPDAGTGAIEGRVVTGSGKPVPGALVSAVDVVTATDTEGRFRLSDVPTGILRLKVAAAGFSFRESRELQLSRGRKIEVPDQVLHRQGLVVRGRVTDSDGTAVAGVRLHLIFQLPRRWWHSVDPVSEEDGYFHVIGPDLEAVLLTISARMDGYRAYSRDLKVTSDTFVEIRLVRLGAVSGSIRFEGVEPERIEVALLEKYETWVHVEWQPGESAFRLPAVACGRRRFRIEAPGFASAEFEAEVPGGGEVEVGEVLLRPKGR